MSARANLVAKAADEGKTALQHAKDFAQITAVIGDVIQAQFAGAGRNTPTGKGVRAVLWQNFEYCNNIIMPGELTEFKTGWRATMRFVLDSNLDPIPVLRAFERYGVRVATGGHPKPSLDVYDTNYQFNIFILSDDYPIQAIMRRFSELDTEPGPTPLKPGKKGP